MDINNKMGNLTHKERYMHLVIQDKLKIIEKGNLKKYENNNIRTTRNRKDNNVIESSRRVYTKWD